MSSEIRTDLIKDKSNTKTLATLSSSAVTLDSSVVFPAGGTGNPISVAVIADVKSSGTNGGGFTNGAWRTRDLNTVISDPDYIVTIESDTHTVSGHTSRYKFTLGAGTYLISWSAGVYKVGSHVTRLYDVTGTASLGYGMSGFGGTGNESQNQSPGSFIHAPTANNTYEIQHQSGSTQGTNGFGVANGISDNIYTKVVIYKLN